MFLKLRTFILIIISSFIFILRTNSQPQSESHVIEVIPPYQEELCLNINLLLEDYVKLDDTTIYWKLINTSLQVLKYDKDESPIVCAPVHLVYKETRNICSKLTLGKWAYFKKENKDIIVDLGAFRKEYKPGEYILNEITGQIQINCLEGDFKPCSNDTNMLKLALTGITLNKFMTTKPNLQLNGQIYEDNYVEYSDQNQPRICFLSNSTHDNLNCKGVNVGVSDYQLLENGSIVLLNPLTILSPNQYTINHDGRLFFCLKEIMTTDWSDQYILETATDNKMDLVKAWFSLIGVSISFVCLFLHTLAFIAFRDLRTYSRQLIFGLAVSLMLADLFWLLRLPASMYVDTCRIVGILTLFCFLASFFWMAVIGFHLNQVFAQSQSLPIRPENQRRWLLIYNIFAWGTASIIVFINILVDYLSENNKFQSRFDYGKICWITRKPALLLFFATPLAIVLIINIIFFFMIFYNSRKILHFTKCNPLEKHKRKFREYCSLFILLGLGWIVGLIAPVSQSKVLEYIFIILTAPHGIYIFIVFTCLASPVRRYMKEQTINALKENAVNADTEKASMTSVDTCDKN